jgi:hypothetical protein
MKNHLFFISYFLCLAGIAFSSCFSSPKHPAELATADSLCKVIAPMDSLFRKTDSLVVKKMFADIDYKLAYIRYNQKDTVLTAEAAILTRYYNAKIVAGIYLKLGGELQRKIKEEKERCANLAHDLRHNTLKSSLDPRTCVEGERMHQASLSLSLNTMGPALLEARRAYKELTPKVDTIIDSLKAKGGQEPPADMLNKAETRDND